jgi:hypothetical protein
MRNKRNRKRLILSEVKWEKGRKRFAASSKHKITKIKSNTVFSTKFLAIVFDHLVKTLVDFFRARVLDSGSRMLLKNRRRSLFKESECSLLCVGRAC